MIRDNLVKVHPPRRLPVVYPRPQLGKDSAEQLLYTDVPMAFADAFSKTDLALSKDPDCYHSGSTCVAMLIRGNDIWVANVGDSRAV